MSRVSRWSVVVCRGGGGIVWLLGALVLMFVPLACTTGPMEIREVHYYAVPNGENTNYFRLKVTAKTSLGVASYREGWFPADAVDSLFGDVSEPGSVKALEAKVELKSAIRKGIVDTTKAWLKEASNPNADPEKLKNLFEARRRVLAYPKNIGEPFAGGLEIEYNPMKSLVAAHWDEKKVYVLASNPDEVVGKMAIDAGGDGVVAGLLPRVVLALHDVAVGAGARIGAEIRGAFRVHERHPRDSNRDTDGGGAEEWEDPQAHSLFQRRLRRIGALVGRSPRGAASMELRR